jgi:GNAT superfamily N-acetyltransferase
MAGIRIGDKWNVDPTEMVLRPYEGTGTDLQALTAVRNDTLRASTLPEDYHDLTPDEMARYYDKDGFSLIGNAWLMLHGESPIAAAIVYPMGAFHDRPPGNFHLYVIPQFRSHGIGSRLMAHLEQAALERGHRVLETTIAQEDEQSCRFLAEHGFQVVGQTVHLARAGMDGLPQVTLPVGFEVWSVKEMGEDAEFYLATANRLGAYDPHYSLIGHGDLDGEPGGWDDAGALVLADGGGRIVGTIRASHDGAGRGYLHEVRLEPASRGKGLGTALVASALSYLERCGVKRVELDTPIENSAARVLAQRAGFQEARHWLRFLKRLGNVRLET